MGLSDWRVSGGVDIHGNLLAARSIYDGTHWIGGVRRFDSCESARVSTVRDFASVPFSNQSLAACSLCVAGQVIHLWLSPNEVFSGGEYNGYLQLVTSANGEAGLGYNKELLNLEEPFYKFPGSAALPINISANFISKAMPAQVGAAHLYWKADTTHDVYFSRFDPHRPDEFDGDGELLPLINIVASVKVLEIVPGSERPLRPWMLLNEYHDDSSRLWITDALTGLWQSDDTGAHWFEIDFTLPTGETPGADEFTALYEWPAMCELGGQSFGLVQTLRGTTDVYFWRTNDLMQTWTGPVLVGSLPALPGVATEKAACGISSMREANSAQIVIFDGDTKIWISNDYGETWAAN